MNKVELIGFAGQDPEIKTIGQNSKVATFSLATSENYKKGDEWVKITHWHRMVGWNKIADNIITQVAKGKKLSIIGRINYKQYEDKNGNKRKDTEIVITEVNEALK
jgi:single-strand DNA-binding protein